MAGISDVKLGRADYVWPSGRPFLTAEWRHLAMLNYEIDPAVIKPLVPQGTEIDFHEGKTYASIVGFLFQQTRVFGLTIPFHVNFEEVNLRFYVRRKAADGWQRGVVFVRELAPRRAVALIANWAYGENYATVPMEHAIQRSPDAHKFERPESLSYSWKHRQDNCRLAMTFEDPPAPLVPGSLDQFITEHYWGYTARRDGATEYQVAHPSWIIAPAAGYEFECNVAQLYGPQFAPPLSAEPASAFWASGSAVRVYPGLRLTAE